MFTYVWCFLELFIGKFIPNIDNEHVQDCSCPGATFAFCSHGKKLPRQGRFTRCWTTDNSPLEVAPGQRKTHVNSYRRQTVHQGKVDHLTPGSVSCPGAMSCPGSCEQALPSGMKSCTLAPAEQKDKSIIVLQ